MGVGDGIRGAYFSIEDKYYGLLDSLDEKGIPIYGLVDIIENAGLPSFPVFLIILLLIIAGVWFLVIPFALTPATTLITFNVSEFSDSEPIEDAILSITATGQDQKLETTNSSGDASLLLPLGVTVNVIAEKDGYSSESRSFTVDASQPTQVFALERDIQFLSKTVQVIDSGTGALVTDQVTIRFSCTNSAVGTVGDQTSAAGRISLQIPENCGSLNAELLGSGSLQQTVLDPTESVSAVTFTPTPNETGTVNVTVLDPINQGIGNARVRLLTQDGIEVNTQLTGNSGATRFDSVPVGNVYVAVNEDSGQFKPHIGNTNVKAVAANQTTEFSITLEEDIVGTIKISVKDTVTSQGVENALVGLWRENVLLDQGYSDSDGKITFPVAESVAFNVTVDHPEYLLESLPGATPSDQVKSIFLRRATNDLANVLFVDVVDPRDIPIEGAKLLLKTLDGTVIVSGISTGANGEASFRNLPNGDSFIVFAAKRGFDGVESLPYAIQPRQENRVKLVLNIGTGIVRTVILDPSGTEIQGAEITAYEIGRGTPLKRQISDLSGESDFIIRADRDVFFVANAPGFLPYTTSRIPIDEGVIKEKTIILQESIDRVDVRLIGLFVGDATATDTLGPGQMYTARLLLQIPQAANEAGIHFRTGLSENDVTNIVEEDVAYIGTVQAGTTTIIRGASYTPPLGFSTDSGRITNGPAKWADVIWRSPTEGVYEAEIEVFVRDTAGLGAQIPIWYRGWSETDGFDRAPLDAELGRNENTAQKQALYANALLAQFSVGTSNLCRAGFCKSFVIEDEKTNAQTFVVNYYPAMISNDYKLGFTVSKTRDSLDSSAEIIFTSDQAGIGFQEYRITGADGSTVSDVAAGSSEIRVPVGNLTLNSVVNGTVDFETLLDGLNTIRIRIVSGDRELFNEVIDVDVEPALSLEIDTVPQEIVPLIDNDVLVQVKDEAGNTVRNALIKVYVNGDLVTTRETNTDGEALVRLQGPNAGSEVIIVAEKVGFRNASITIDVDDSLLFVRPEEINERLTFTQFLEKTDLTVKNRSPIELVISNATFTNSFDDLVEFDVFDDPVGTTLPVETDLNFVVESELTDDAFDTIRSTTKVEGTFSLYALSPELSRTFVTNIPVKITIGLGDQVDDDRCLIVQPPAIDIFTDTEQREIDVMLTNNCTVDRDPINLRNVEVKLDNENENDLGTFVLEAKTAGFETTALNSDFVSIADVFEGGDTAEFTLVFNPNGSINAGDSMPDIVFQSVNITNRDDEIIDTAITTNININDLAECVEVIRAPQLITEVAPFNLGFGGFNNFGSYPQNNLSNPSFGNPGSGLNGINGGGIGYSFPSAGYTNPFFTRSFDTNADGNFSFGPGLSAFTVQNNCSIPVEVKVDSGPFLQTDKDTFPLPVNENEVVQIQSGNRVGRYEIAVKAKRETSEDAFKEVDRVPVVVQSLEEIGENCISLSTNSFRFGYGGAPLVEQVINECYDSGVRLKRGQDGIRLLCQLSGSPYGGFQQPGIGFEAGIEGETASFQFSQGFFPGGNNGISQYPYGQGNFAGAGGAYNNPYSGYGYNSQSPYGNGFGGNSYGQQPVYGNGYYNYGGQGRGQYYPSSYGAGQPGLGASIGGNGQCPLIQGVNPLGTRFANGTRSSGNGGVINEFLDFEVIPVPRFGAGGFGGGFGQPGFGGIGGGFGQPGLGGIGQPGLGGFGQPGLGGGFGQPGLGGGFGQPGLGGGFGQPGLGGFGQPGLGGGFGQPGLGGIGGGLGIGTGIGINPGALIQQNFLRDQQSRANGIAEVGFTSPLGQMGLERIRIFIENPFPFIPNLPPFFNLPQDGDDGSNGGGGGDPDDYGDEGLDQQQCINPGAYDTVTYWAQAKSIKLGFTPNEAPGFSGNTLEWKPGQSPTNSIPLIIQGGNQFGGSVCSAVTVKDPKSDYKEQEGIKITFKEGEGNKTIVMTVDKSAMTAGLKCVDIKTRLTFEEFRPIQTPQLNPFGGAGFAGTPPQFQGAQFCGATTGVRIASGLAGTMIELEKAKKGLKNAEGNAPTTDGKTILFEGTETQKAVASSDGDTIYLNQQINSGPTGNVQLEYCQNCSGGKPENQTPEVNRKYYVITNGQKSTRTYDLATAQNIASRFSRPTTGQQPFTTNQPTNPFGPAPGTPSSGQQGFLPNTNNANAPAGTQFGGLYGQGQRNRRLHTVPVTIRVLNEGVDPSSINAIEDCKGETPPVQTTDSLCKIPNSYTTLGFDKLSFDWSWQFNTEEICSAQFKQINSGIAVEPKDVAHYVGGPQGFNYVCDGAQASISFLKMGETVSLITEKAFEHSENTVKKEKEFETTITQYDNSLNTWRFAKQQAAVEEQIEGKVAQANKNGVFFIRETNRTDTTDGFRNIVTDRKGSDELRTKLNGQEAPLKLDVSSGINLDKVRLALDTLLEEPFASRIVGTYENNTALFKDNVIGKASATQKPTIPEQYGAEKLGKQFSNYGGKNSKDIYVMTINEFNVLWSFLTEPFMIENKNTRDLHFSYVTAEKIRGIANNPDPTKVNCAVALPSLFEEVKKLAPGTTFKQSDAAGLTSKRFPLCTTNTKENNTNGVDESPAKAVTCFVCAGKTKDDTEIVEISTDFLQNFIVQLQKNTDSETYNVLGFKVGLRHTPNTPFAKSGEPEEMQFRDSVFDATDIKEIKPLYTTSAGGEITFAEQEGYQFNEFFYRYIDFETYLMEDNLNNLREAFSTTYATKIAELGGMIGTVTTDWELPTIEEGKTGKYRVILDYDPTATKRDEHQTRLGRKKTKWHAVLETTVVPPKHIGEIGNKYGDNVFMFLPFDGDLKASGTEAKSFGVGFTLDKETTSVGISPKGSGTSALKTDAKFYTGKGHSEEATFNKFNSTDGDDLKTQVGLTKPGTVIGIEKSSEAFAFFPSKPFIFDLSSTTGKPFTFVYTHEDALPDTTGVFTWRNKETGNELAGANLPLSKLQRGACEIAEGLSKPFQGFYRDEEAGARSYVGYAYLPAHLKGTALIKAWCGLPSITVNASNIGKNLKGSGPQIAAKVPVQPGSEEERSIYYIKDYIDLLNENDYDGDTPRAGWLCVEEATADKIKIAWNTKEVTGKEKGIAEPTGAGGTGTTPSGTTNTGTQSTPTTGTTTSQPTN
jgi:hypothetical protein